MTPPARSPFGRFVAELRRRRVSRVAAAYGVIAWLLIQIASDVFPALRLPEWTVTLAVVLLLLGFPIALVLAWAYDVTPEGVVRTEATEPPSAPTRTDATSARGRRLAGRAAMIGAVAVLALAGGAFVAGHLRDDGNEAEVESAQRVAVLPFQVRGSERLAYLAEGVVDLLSTDLARAGALETIDPNELLAALASRSAAVDPEQARAIATQFGAGLYVLGSVFELEGRVRITASLYERSRGGRPISTHTVEGAVADVIPLVARLAAELANAAPSRRRGPGARLVWSGDTVDVMGTPSQDGRLFAFTDWYTGDLAVRDFAAQTSRRLTDTGGWDTSSEYPEYPVFSPDGHWIAYAWFNADFKYEVRLLDSSGAAAPKQLLHGDSGWMRVHDWKRDGSAVLVLHFSRTAGRVLWVPVAGGKVDTIAARINETSRMLVSPDDRWIAYDYADPANPRDSDVYLMPAAGGAQGVVVRSPATDVLLGWLPSGSHLLFWSDRGAEAGVWAVRVEGGRAAAEPVLVRGGMGWMHAVRFAGADYLYGVVASEQQVHSLALDFERAAVLEPPVPAAHAAAHSSSSGVWSLDGTQLAYISGRPGGQPLTASVAVRELATGSVREYPILLYYPRVHQWLDRDVVLVGGRSPSGDVEYRQLNLQTGVSRLYETGESNPDDRPRGLIVTRDGRTHYFLRWRESATSYYVRDRASGRETLLWLSEKGGGGAMRLSPDERYLSFGRFSMDSTRFELWILPTTGAPPRMLKTWASSQSVLMGGFEWSLDGRYLIYALTHPDDRSELRVLRVSDGDDRLLTVSGPFPSQIRLHPDGRRVAVTLGRSRSELWALERPMDALR
jgi:Tol biopolymer transport system component/TolB-like protein